MELDNLWARLTEEEKTRGKAVHLRAVFSGDAAGKTPVTLVLRDGEPRVQLSPEAKALFDCIDPKEVAARHVDEVEASRWVERFNEARHEDLLTPNALCRLLFGPYYRPSRRIYAFNANVELRIDPHDAAEWFPDLDPDDPTWPSLSDLAERLRADSGDEKGAVTVSNGSASAPPVDGTAARAISLPPVDSALALTGRVDANRMALNAVRAVLDSAEAFEVVVEEKRVVVAVQRLPPELWPKGGLSGLDAKTDGPLPGAIRARCRWEGGETTVVVSIGWAATGTYRQAVAVQARVFGKQIVWSSVAATLKSAADGATVPISGWCALYTQKDEVASDEKPALSRALKSVVARSGLPLLSESRIRLFEVGVPAGDVQPSPAEAFRRIVHLTLLKLPFFVRQGEDGTIAASLFDAQAVQTTTTGVENGPSSDGEKFAGLYPLPGGVRQYKATLDAILGWLAEEPRAPEAFLGMLKDRYEVTGPVAAKSYLRLLENLSFVEDHEDGRLDVTDSARAYLEAPQPATLFDLLSHTFSGVLETLVITGELGTANPVSTKRILEEILEADWKSPNQTSFRRNWLLSLGLTDRKARGDVLTELGRSVLASNASDAEPVRGAVAAIVAEEPDLALPVETEDEVSVGDDTLSDTPGLIPTPVKPTAAPASWDADRLDLTVGMLDEHLAGLRLPSSVLEQACAALSSGKHLLLVGPPGNGKTKLALALAGAARAENYCHGAFLATASADWTTFDTIGGYALEKDSALRFRPGVFLAAIERWQWLLIRRAQSRRRRPSLRGAYDRARGRYLRHGVPVARRTDRLDRDPRQQLAPNVPDVPGRGDHEHLGQDFPVPPLIRGAATLRDRPCRYPGRRDLRRTHRSPLRFGAGFDDPLDEGAKTPLKALFRERGLLAQRLIGPAILEDIVAYMRRRRASGDGLAEAMAMYLLPQLEGLEQEQASVVFKKLQDSLTGWTSAGALAVLRTQYWRALPPCEVARGMNGPPAWQRFVAENFPGYLLPASALNALSAEEAARFLERITGEPDQLGLLRAASTLSPRLAMLEEFALRDLPELVRSLPSQTEVHQREWEGGFHGRLDIPATAKHRLMGRVTRFVTRARHRQFDLPENELVRAVATRLLELLTRLRQARIVSSAGWGAMFASCEGELRRLLSATVLRKVSVAPITGFHEQAARGARRDVYRRALLWHVALREGLDVDTPETIARVVAEGALAPLDEPTKFELAVVVG